MSETLYGVDVRALAAFKIFEWVLFEISISMM
jgi:hypothetical protein